MIKVGIIGHGVVGSALVHYLRHKTKATIEGKVYDPPQGLITDISQCDIFFIAVPVPTNEDRTQDLSIVHKSLDLIPKGRPVFIKSSVLPGTCDMIRLDTGHAVYAMPEFLTERTAREDILKHPVICGGADVMPQEHMSLVLDLFQAAHFMTNREAELSKYAHNAFAAVKVNFFNTIYCLSQLMRCDYQNILTGITVSGFIEKTHTQVPGPDGKLGYGGKCLPKDLKALIGLLQDNLVPTRSLLGVEAENAFYRGKDA